ncbi:MAG: MFS transporter, partial [Limnobacter sp.]
MNSQPASIEKTLPAQGRFVAGIVGAAAFAHLLNDLIQAMLPAVFPMLKS